MEVKAEGIDGLRTGLGPWNSGVASWESVFIESWRERLHTKHVNADLCLALAAHMCAWGG